MVRDRSGGMDGVLVVAKPAGPTSHDVVALIRRLSATRRVGHGGTLDPFAGGVLPIFLGRATRLVEFHLGADKHYRATICFGATSTTDDLEGELSPVEGPPPARESVVAALGRSVGTVEQRPPDHSAVKVGGRRAYALARAGRMPELRRRTVTIHRLELVDWDAAEPDRPVALVEVECSAGTYVRALARDLGAAVGSGAYLGALVRTRSGPFGLADAIALETVRSAAAEGPAAFAALLRPIDAGLDRLPVARVSVAEVADLTRGRLVRPAGGGDRTPGPVRVVGPDGRLVAIAVWRDGRLAPDKVLIERTVEVGRG